MERGANRAVVWSQFARTVSIVDLAASEPAVR